MLRQVPPPLGIQGKASFKEYSQHVQEMGLMSYVHPLPAGQAIPTSLGRFVYLPAGLMASSTTRTCCWRAIASRMALMCRTTSCSALAPIPRRSTAPCLVPC